ncbi:hypothetical protein DFS34DRAFT_703439 [Phlyctochytrium arcticum]|nr:hypothetical protein DFS34DRAFT_703439 [Phlyctochytrium arcticum]
MAGPQHFIVLGGGISGLSAAWYFSRLAPASARITLVDQSSRLGGWVRTEQDPETGDLLEVGPRTLRPAGAPGKVTLQMVYDLGLASEILTVSKSSPAARNRFIYKDGQLHQLPSSPLSLLLPSAFLPSSQSSPLTQGLLRSILKEPSIPPATSQDESIYSFISRRFGTRLATIASAVIHGIYAGDSRALSVKSTMPSLWRAEQRSGSVLKGMLLPQWQVPSMDSWSRQIKSAFSPQTLVEASSGLISGSDSTSFVRGVQKQSSIYSFKNGIESLTKALENSLIRSRNVTILRNTTAERISLSSSSSTAGVDVFHSASPKPISATHLISALPASSLSRLLPTKLHSVATALQSIPSVDVAVINLTFRGAPKDVLPVNGFGYLVPETEDTPILGIILDSCAMPHPASDVEERTRVTVMLGGHKLNKYFSIPPGSEESATTQDLFLTAALSAARKQLGVTVPLTNYKVSFHRQCIPQYTVGHSERLKTIHEGLTRDGQSRVSVIGASYLGVGINDCVVGAKEVVDGILLGGGGGISGLERGLED